MKETNMNLENKNTAPSGGAQSFNKRRPFAGILRRVLLYSFFSAAMAGPIFIYHHKSFQYGNAIDGCTAAAEMTTLTKEYLDQGGNPQGLDLTSFPAAYSDITQGVMAKDNLFQYTPPDGASLNPAFFNVLPDGTFKYIGKGKSPYLKNDNRAALALGAILDYVRGSNLLFYAAVLFLVTFVASHFSLRKLEV